MQLQQKRIEKMAHAGGVKRKLTLAVAVASLCTSGMVQAVTLKSDRDWRINADTTVAYLLGIRAEDREDKIADNPGNAQGDYQFDQGDLVSNRLSALVELQAIYQNRMGARVTASAWKDFAYDKDVEGHPDDSYPLSYSSGEYSSHTRKFHRQGAELLDAYVFSNFDVVDTPVSLKLGRFSQQWGNSLFFGFAGISYGQHPIDFIKGFTQPGSSVKELILPRAQVLATIGLTPELSLSAQYFLEFRPNRFPEAGTYLAPSDILYEGPDSAEPVFGPGFTAGRAFEPDDVNDNFGIRLDWSPMWAGGDRFGFYYRKLDETQPWTQGEIFLDPSAPNGISGNVHLAYAEDVSMYAVSYETAIGPASLGFEVNYRVDTALASAFVSGELGEYREGARGDVVNVLANSIINLSGSALYDTGIILAEVAYTHLADVSKNEQVFLHEDYDSCVDATTGGQGDKDDGCATDDAVAVSVLFEPSWLQVFPSVDISAPMSVQYGLYGNPAYAAGAFYAEDSIIWSVGLSANVKQSHNIALKYQDYRWTTKGTATNQFGNEQYAGGNGPFALNDKGWVSLSYSTSF